MAVLEHLDIDLVKSMNELWRISKKGCILTVKLPMWDSESVHDDPTHRWFFTERSLHYFDPSTEIGKNYGFYTDKKWKILEDLIFTKTRSSFTAKMTPIK